MKVSREITQIDPDLRLGFRSLLAGDIPWPLFLHGPAGTGKTCALLCLLDHAGGEYYTASGLCEMLIQSQQGRLSWREGGRGGELWPEMVWKSIRLAPLVVLDELGCRQKVSDFAYETVNRLVDDRLGLPLAVASNFDLEAVASLYDDRLASRLAPGTVLALTGSDRRVKSC